MPTVQERFLDKLSSGKIGKWKALNEACLKGWPQVAADVLRCRPEMVRSEHLSKLHRSLAHLYTHGDSPERANVIRALVAGGLNPATPGIVAGGPLMLEAWLDCGAPIDGTGSEDRPLHVSIEGRSSPDAALLLIKRGADVDAVDEEGRTPLMIAARCGHVKIAKALLEHGCDTLAVDATGRSAFRHAVEAATSMGLHVTPSGAAKARTIARLLADRSPAQPEDAALAVLLKDDVDALSRWLESGLPPGEELAGSLGPTSAQGLRRSRRWASRYGSSGSRSSGQNTWSRWRTPQLTSTRPPNHLVCFTGPLASTPRTAWRR